MKRRDFLSAPVALVGLGLAAGGGRLAQAAPGASNASFTVLRLAGSAGEDDAFGEWQQYWPQTAPSLTHARITVYGFVRGTAGTLGAIDIESVFFNDRGGVNTALVYSASDGLQSSGSGPIGFYVQAPNFGGFSLNEKLPSTSKTAKLREASAGVAVLGDAQTGALAEGLYVALHRNVDKPLDTTQFVYTGYDDRPLTQRNGRPVAYDYLAFRVDAA